MRGWIRVAACALLFGVAACDNNGSNPVQVLGSTTGVRVDVGAGTTPQYTWMGGRARSLTVQSSSGEVFWQVEAVAPEEGFSSPAQHGITPVGARLVVNARPLEPGTVTIATVTTVTGNTGFRTFTPTTITP
jgi:hypothetical protein